MSEFIVTFAGGDICFQYQDEAAASFLALLFADLHGTTAAEYEKVFVFVQTRDSEQYCLLCDGEELFTGQLDVAFAATVFDRVIFHFLDTKKGGLAIHAGAVICQGKVVMLPGQSGFGKSSLTTWLIGYSCSYLTDELVFLPEDNSQPACYFTRPLCIKTGSLPVVEEIADQDDLLDTSGHDRIAGSNGAVLPHRLFNPDYTPTPDPPELFLFPAYQAGASLVIEKVSSARGVALLMECAVNARNLSGHGFQQVAEIARNTPMYRVVYGSFAGMDVALAELLEITE